MQLFVVLFDEPDEQLGVAGLYDTEEAAYQAKEALEDRFPERDFYLIPYMLNTSHLLDTQKENL